MKILDYEHEDVESSSYVKGGCGFRNRIQYPLFKNQCFESSKVNHWSMRLLKKEAIACIPPLTGLMIRRGDYSTDQKLLKY